MRMIRSRRAVSIVISTLIISAAVLVVTAVASFLGMNVLELQNQQAEFEQGKANMRILGEIIDDVGVKPGAGSSIRFNERVGGLGYVVNDDRTLKITVTNGTQPADGLITLSNTPMNITYRGGRLVSTYNSNIVGDDALTVSGLAHPLGHLRQIQANGAWLQIDFNRVRIVNETIVNVGSDQYHMVTVTFFNVTPGEFTGSGALDVKVQNIGINHPVQFSYYNAEDPDLNQVTITVSYGDVEESSFHTPLGTKGIIVMVTVSNIELSTL